MTKVLYAQVAYTVHLKTAWAVSLVKKKANLTSTYWIMSQI